jgi:dTDP-4-dehydrorhamnose reductase
MALHLLMFGKTGQLARAIQTHADKDGHSLLTLSRQDCDLSAPTPDINATLDTVMRTNKRPDIVIIAAAYTDVDGAETDTSGARKTNADAPGAIANKCAELGIPLIHISTDYVFDGQADTPYLPDHMTAPINTYGASKLAGEQAICDSGCRAVILRTSWVFDGIGKNFFTTMMRLAQSRDSLDVVDDQIGRPTYAGHLAQAVLHIATRYTQESQNTPENARTSIYHVSGNGAPVSWAGFAREIFAQAGSLLPRPVHVQPIAGAAFKTAAKRPNYSVLDMGSFERAFDMALPDWTKGLEAALKEYAKRK